MEIKFFETFQTIGDTDNMAELVNIVNGVINPDENEIPGANAARAINPNASAPPNKPILQITIAAGVMIKDIPTLTSVFSIFGVKKIRTADIPPKTNHRKSLISLFFKSQ